MENRVNISPEQLRRAHALTAAFAGFLSKQRWYGGKADAVAAIEVPVCIPLTPPERDAFLLVVRVQYASGRVEEYSVPLKAVTSGEQAGGEGLFVMELESGGTRIAFSDALLDREIALFLLECIHRGATVHGDSAQLAARSTEALGALLESSGGCGALEPSVMRVEQSNTSIRYGRRLILKFLRRVEEGVNLDVETGVFLTTRFQHTPPVAGWLELRREGRAPATLAVLQGFVENCGDAWKYALEALAEYFARTATLKFSDEERRVARLSLHDLAEEDPPGRAGELVGSFLPSAALLGRRTAELHLALSSDLSDPRFAPEPFSPDDRRRAVASMEELASRAFGLLEAQSAILEPPISEKAQSVLSRRRQIISLFHQLIDSPVTASRTRLHGDYHLGQVLYTGSDFAIIDFEGEPERPLAERRAKRSPLRDVAGMLRSFDYAANTARDDARIRPHGAAGSQPPSLIESWRQYWTRCVSAAFLRSYLAAAGGACFIPQDHDGLRKLLDIFLLEKAVYEIIYEVKNRPGWVMIPLDGILALLASDKSAAG